MSLDDECAIQRQPENSRRAPRLEAFELADHLGAKFIEAESRHRRNRNHRRARERSAIGKHLDFVANLADARVVDKVRLGDEKDSAPRTEQMQDVEMLLALRHHAVVGRYGEQHQIDAMRAREHVADEALMARDINDTRSGAIGQREIREAEIDRDPALLFLLEAVGVVPGQRLDERGLAVVDVTGSTDDRMSDLRRHRLRYASLRHLLGKTLQIEVVAPQGDFSAAHFEHPGHRQLDALLADIEHVDALVEHDISIASRYAGF